MINNKTFSISQNIRIYLLLAIVLISASYLLSTLANAQQCEPCTEAQQLAEYREIFRVYRAAVGQARADGFQCYSDSNYYDPGSGEHPPGNCADWQAVTWNALVKKQWNCWTVVRIRARQKFTFVPPIYHHFVALVPKCGGRRIYLDPWSSGTPNAADEDNFEFANGFFSWWIHYPMDRHIAGSPGR